MGYYTKFDIDVYHPGTLGVDADKIEAIRNRLEEISRYNFDTRTELWDEYKHDISSSDHYKWYDYDADMLKLSEEFPFYVFTVHGSGESPEDLWQHKFFKGKHKRSDAIFTIPPIELEELQ